MKAGQGWVGLSVSTAVIGDQQRELNNETLTMELQYRLKPYPNTITMKSLPTYSFIVRIDL